MPPASFEPTVSVGERPQTYGEPNTGSLFLFDNCFSAARVGIRMSRLR